MIKTLWKSLREYKKTSLLTIGLTLFEVVFEIVIPLCMAELIDRGVEQGEMNLVLKYGLALVVFALLQLMTGMGSALAAARSAAGFAANLRQDMYDNVQTFSFSNIDKFSTSSIVTRLTTDVTNVQNAYQMLIKLAMRGPFMILFAMVVSFRINRGISLVFLALIPVLGIGLILIVRTVHPIFQKVFENYDRLNNVVQENLRGVRVVKSFHQQSKEIEKFDRVSERIYQDFAKAERLISLNTPLLQFCLYLSMLLISWLGAKAIVASGNNAALGLTTGDLTALFSYAIQILMSLMMLSMVLTMIIMARASAERITEILNEESDLKNGSQPIEEVKDGSVVFENVSFSYAKDPSKECLKNVNLTVKSGETVGILGGTGTSKTTLVQLIPRLYDATEGRVLVGGADVRDYDMDALRDQVAMVLQKNVLFSGTIKDNLRWGKKDATDEEMVRMCQLAQADSFIQEFPDKYDTYIEQGGSNVSGGQKQRLCIARALLKHPKILILDDSTSAVDTKTDALIRKAFLEEIPDTTKFIIAQRVSSIEDADKILVMDGGQIVAMGTHDELLKTCDIYRETYESQMKGGSDNEQ